MQSYIKYFILILIIIFFIIFKFKNLIKNEYIYKKFDKEGFIKISNIVSDKDIEFFNDIISDYQLKFPDCISIRGNNENLYNIDRYSYKLTPTLPKYGINHNIPDISIGIIKDYKTYKEKFGEKITRGTFTSQKNKDMYIKNNKQEQIKFNISYEKYLNSTIYTKLLHYTSDFIHKLKLKYPNIFNLNYELYHIISFFILPNSIEQEIHKDDFYIDYNYPLSLKNGNLKSDTNLDEINSNLDNKFILEGLQIFIPLHDTPLECGPTIIYKKNKVDYNYIENNNYDSKIGYFNDSEKGYSINKDIELKNIFSNARTNTPLKKGDIVFMKNNIYHSGGHNNSNITRKFILIQLIHIPDYTNHKLYHEVEEILKSNLPRNNNNFEENQNCQESCEDCQNSEECFICEDCQNLDKNTENSAL